MRTRSRLAVAVAALLANADPIHAQVPKGRITVVDIIPRAQSGETNQDSEASLAINPRNTHELVASTVTPSQGFCGTRRAPVFVTSDEGNNWVLSCIIPTDDGGSGTGDISVRYGESGTLYAGILRFPGYLRLNILRTSNVYGPDPMAILVDRDGVDQPSVKSIGVLGQNGIVRDRVYVGNNDFSAPQQRSATIDVSSDGAASPPAFRSLRIESRNTPEQDGPPIRVAAHRDGTTYAAFYGWRGGGADFRTADVIVVRDDDGVTGSDLFGALKDKSDGLSGALVASSRVVPWQPESQPTFGQERLVASHIAIAVDPRTSATVIVTWGDKSQAGDYRLHLARSNDRGMTWRQIMEVSNAINPGVAINAEGVIGFLFQRLVGPGQQANWETHLLRT
ncbi:MAG: BNR/Asp-box repeat protein, partial [Planctomycetaceae bacterium]|nr:BNR/Asp-box repeat protein [Planctomycetaceae bacterium]